MFFINHFKTPTEQWEIELAKAQLEKINQIKSEWFRNKNQKRSKIMINNNNIIKMNEDNTIITIPNEIMLSVWTLPENENKSIGEVIPEVMKTVNKILQKLKNKKGDNNE